MKPTLLLAFAAALIAMAPPVRAEKTVEEIEACLRTNQPSGSSIQTVTLRSIDRVGTESDFSAKIYWKEHDEGNRVLLRIYSPESRRGSALLLIQKGDRSDMWMYLPDLRKVKRISQHSISGSMFGTDLSYEDFERIQGMTDEASSQRLADASQDGRPVWVIEVKPARASESGYERIVTFVDQEWCLPLKLEHFEQGGRLRKVITLPADKVTLEGSQRIPRLVRVEDRVDGTHTDVIIDEIELGAKISNTMFSEGNLEFR